MTVGQDGNTSYGTSVETIAAKLTELGADVVGLNCSVGPAAMLDAIERMVERPTGRSRPSRTPDCPGRWTTGGSISPARNTWDPTPGG